LKLYDSRRAPNPRRVRWFMAEKGIEDIEIVDVDIFGGQHRTPEYLAKAGLPNVPALEMDDGRTITESVAICRYPGERLSRAQPVRRRRLRVRRHRDVDAAGRDDGRHAADDDGAPQPSGHGGHRDPDPRSAANNRATAEKGLKVLDRRLAESDFIACERVTMADILAATAIDFARMARFRPDPELVNVKRWLRGMMARPAAKAGV
jgi:glutathione S-transferase